jgi:predicted GNAT family acetyltransferase
MISNIQNKIKEDLKNLINKDTTVDIFMGEISFKCTVKIENKIVHTLTGILTDKGIYLRQGFTHPDYRRQGIAQSVRKSIHSVLKEENKGVLYTDSKEFIDPAKTPDNISPLYELWEKLVTEGKAEKQGNEYTMI